MNIFEEIVDRLKNNTKINMFYVSIVITILSYLITKDYNVFYIVIEMLCASLTMAIVFITFTKKYKSNSIFNYIGYGFTLLCFINTVHIVLINSMEVGSFESKSTIFVWLANNYLEYMIIIISTIFTKIKPKVTDLIFAYGLVIFGIGLFSLFTLNFQGTASEYLIVGYNIWKYTAILFFVALLLIHKYKYYIGRSESKYLYTYLLLVFIYEYIVKLYFTFSIQPLVFVYIIKYLAYYFLYRALNEYILFESYSSMYDDLLKVEDRHIQLNKTLNDRLNILKEVKIILSKSEKKYVSLLESISDGIIIFHFDEISYANKASTYFIDISLDKVKNITLGDTLEKLGLKYSLSNEKFLEESINIEIAGEEKYLDIYMFESEENTKILFIKDVTEKNINYNLKIELQKYLGEENVKNEFYANISHELRTPINLIYTSLQIKELYIQDNNYEAIEKNTVVIKQNCLRLIRTINNFIDANKISENYLRPNYGIYNIVELVENAAQASVRYIEKMKMSLVFDSEREEIYTICDWEFVQRAVLNLLSNSVKFGKVDGDIYVTIYINKDKLCISVKNNGSGISSDIKPYLFDRFTKINKSLNRDKEGSGLGLYLCRSLIELQQGELVLISEEAYGNEFLITFPYEEIHIENKDSIYKSFEINDLVEKVDIEFSDIYLSDM